MRILIYGAGVIGSLYGAQLAEAGHDVSVYARGLRLYPHVIITTTEADAFVEKIISFIDDRAY